MFKENFLRSIKSLFPDITNIISIKYIVKAAISLAFYSKLFLICSPFIKCPEVVITLATSYWEVVTLGYANLVLFITGTLNLVKSIIEESKNNTVNDLNENISDKNKIIEDLQLINDKQQQKIDNLHENSVPREIYHEQNTAQQNTIAELTGELRTVEHTNRNLTAENTDLSNTVRTLKATSAIERTQHYLTILGNAVFIGAQVINAYNSLFNNTGQTNPEDIKRILTSVNSLVSRFNTQQTQNTASARSQQSAAIGGPSSGLTSAEIPTDDI